MLGPFTVEQPDLELSDKLNGSFPLTSPLKLQGSDLLKNRKVISQDRQVVPHSLPKKAMEVPSKIGVDRKVVMGTRRRIKSVNSLLSKMVVKIPFHSNNL